MFARSVFVTGCNRGIGLELVKQLADKTEHLFAACRSPTEANELKSIADAYKHIVMLEVDVTNGEKIREAVNQISDVVGREGLNCLINNAGVIDRFSPIEDVTIEGLQNLFYVNAIGPAMVVKACLPLLRQASYSITEKQMCVTRVAVLNISTELGSIHQNKGGKLYGYRMSKAALNMLTKNLSIELKADNILAVSIHPGWVKTDLGGGDKATLTVTESVEGILKMASKLSEEDTGLFYGWDGNQLHW